MGCLKAQSEKREVYCQKLSQRILYKGALKLAKSKPTDDEKGKVYRRKPTELQAKIIEYIAKSQPCMGIDACKALGITFGGINKSMKIPVKKGIVAQDKKTKLWYMVDNKPLVIERQTKKKKCADYLQRKKVIHYSELSQIAKNPVATLSSMKNAKSIGNGSWEWVE